MKSNRQYELDGKLVKKIKLLIRSTASVELNKCNVFDLEALEATKAGIKSSHQQHPIIPVDGQQSPPLVSHITVSEKHSIVPKVSSRSPVKLSSREPEMGCKLLKPRKRRRESPEPDISILREERIVSQSSSNSSSVSRQKIKIKGARPLEADGDGEKPSSSNRDEKASKSSAREKKQWSSKLVKPSVVKSGITFNIAPTGAGSGRMSKASIDLNSIPLPETKPAMVGPPNRTRYDDDFVPAKVESKVFKLKEDIVEDVKMETCELYPANLELSVEAIEHQPEKHRRHRASKIEYDLPSEHRHQPPPLQSPPVLPPVNESPLKSGGRRSKRPLIGLTPIENDIIDQSIYTTPTAEPPMPDQQHSEAFFTPREYIRFPPTPETSATGDKDYRTPYICRSDMPSKSDRRSRREESASKRDASPSGPPRGSSSRSKQRSRKALIEDDGVESPRKSHDYSSHHHGLKPEPVSRVAEPKLTKSPRKSLMGDNPPEVNERNRNNYDSAHGRHENDHAFPPPEKSYEALTDDERKELRRRKFNPPPPLPVPPPVPVMSRDGPPQRYGPPPSEDPNYRPPVGHGPPPMNHQGPPPPFGYHGPHPSHHGPPPGYPGPPPGHHGTPHPGRHGPPPGFHGPPPPSHHGPPPHNFRQHHQSMPNVANGQPPPFPPGPIPPPHHRSVDMERVPLPSREKGFKQYERNTYPDPSQEDLHERDLRSDRHNRSWGPQNRFERYPVRSDDDRNNQSWSENRPDFRRSDSSRDRNGRAHDFPPRDIPLPPRDIVQEHKVADDNVDDRQDEGGGGRFDGNKRNRYDNRRDDSRGSGSRDLRGGNESRMNDDSFDDEEFEDEDAYDSADMERDDLDDDFDDLDDRPRKRNKRGGGNRFNDKRRGRGGRGRFGGRRGGNNRGNHQSHRDFLDSLYDQATGGVSSSAGGGHSGVAEKFTLFFTKKFPFSNHYPCDRLEIDGSNFTCTEQYYMYMKAVVFKDDVIAQKILKAKSGGEHKKLSSEIKNFDPQVWDGKGLSKQFMERASEQKYRQNRHLRLSLFATLGTTLVECNPKDKRWGIGLAMHDSRAFSRSTWQGQNWLGEMLTKIRDRLMKEHEYADDLREAEKNPNFESFM